MIMYKKFKIEYFWARNVFIRSKMDNRMAYVTLEEISRYILKVQDQVLFGQKYVH